MKDLVDIQRAAEMLGVSERFMRRLVAERRITIQRVGRFIRFRPEDLEEWLDAQREPAIR